MLTMLCGRSRALWPRVAREIGEAVAAGEENLLLITPAQYTLQAELDLVDGLHLPGLFSVQVLSPESLARQVFARAGAPTEADAARHGAAFSGDADSNAGPGREFSAAVSGDGSGAAQADGEDMAEPSAALVPARPLNAAGRAMVREGAARLGSEDMAEPSAAPVPARPLNAAGRAMTLETALRRCRPSFRYYQSAAERRGFRDHAAAAIASLKQARLSPDAVRSAAASVAADDPSLALKLGDLSALFSAYEAQLSDRFLDAEDMREALCARIVQSGFVRGARVWFYGFDLVTPQLMRLTALMAREAESVRFALAWAAEAAPDGPVFQPARDTLARFARYLDREGMQWKREILAEPSAAKPPLAHLARALFALDAAPFMDDPGDALTLCAAADPSDEAARIAASLRRLAFSGVPLDTIAVVFGDEGSCAGPLSRALERAGIPYHLDAKRPALSHPLPRALLSAVQCACDGYQADDMFDLIKSGLVGVTREESDTLENYARARGLRGAAWERPAEDDAVEDARRRLMEPLCALRQGLREAKTAAESVGALYRWLEDAHVYETLEQWEASFSARALHEQAADCALSWRLTMETLDQLHTLLGGERLAMKDAPRALEAGFSASELGTLPAQPGAVHCGALGHVKLGANVRAMFLMGMQDGVLRPAEGGLFSDEEAERAAQASGADAFGLRGDALACLRQMNLLDMLAAPTETLAISYALSASDGAAQRPASWLKLFKRLFPTVSEGDGRRCANAWYAPGPAMDALGAALRAAQSSGELPEDVKNAALCLLDDPQTAAQARRLLDALGAPAEPAPLSEETVRSLYRFTRLSATRLESFARCPFRHFVQYGLAPKEREEFEVDRRDVGTFCHRAMERYARLALRTADWPNVSREASDAIMDEALAPIREEWAEGPLGATAASRAEGEALCRAAKRTAWTYATQMAESDFRTVAVEARFGPGEKLPALELPRQNGKTAPLGGKIDRLDVFRAEDGTNYVRVVDYKTGGISFDFSQAAAGMQLQLPLYLAAAANAEKNARPAAACYGRFTDPLIETDSRDGETIEKKIGAEMRLRGVLLDDPLAAQASEDRASLLNKDGSLRKGAGLSQRAMDGLLKQAQRLAGAMVDAIEAGEAAPCPTRCGGKLACAQCDFAAVCGYDARRRGAPVREVEKLTKEEAVRRLEELE